MKLWLRHSYKNGGSKSENDEIMSVKQVIFVHGACNITLEKVALEKDLPL